MASPDERFDGMFLTCAQQMQGIEPLLDTMFSFLRRKTDFFSGASPQQIEELVLNVIRKQASLAERDAAEKKAAKEKDEKKKREKLEKEKKKKEEIAKAAASKDDVLELGDDGTFEVCRCTFLKVEYIYILYCIWTFFIYLLYSPPCLLFNNNEMKCIQASSTEGGKSKSSTSSATPTPPTPPSVTDEEGDVKDAAAIEEEEDKTPAPIGNGGSTDKYTWTQTLSELTVVIPLPPGTKTKMLDIKMTNTHLKVGIKGQPLLVDADLHKRVIVDDSLWTLEDGDLVFNFQKDNKMEWWKCVCVGDPEINTQKVQPENSKLGDLDGETRQTVEKMMFDQRQKAMGLPSSEEMQKQEMLKKFMSAHPEMDFSQAKFT